jgi:hypothetical protein
LSNTESLTTTNLLAAASGLLLSGGYQQVHERSVDDRWRASNVRLFEDRFGIVAIVVYETWRDLLSRWPDAQAALVDLISQNVSSNDAKAWEGYLVLLTLGVGSHSEVNTIRYDTSRVRKLVATGDDLRILADVERALLPLLPLGDVPLVAEQDSALEMLPQLLQRRNIPEEAVRLIVLAFREQQPLLEQLHRYRTNK